MNKKVLISAGVTGVLAVLIGAFAAHGLKTKISNEAMQSFQTGVRYQMYHALLLLFVGSTSMLSIKSKKMICYMVIMGVFFFSCSIYGLATNALSNFDFKTIGFITPIGGLFLVGAWITMIIGFLKFKMN
ncbi:DUF423 domain-containing protein [Lacinutrix neustonica]|uniref:DUF423 domain-containing protein n=1 Tax=Lacinutrix neustonica TaxID=2980107 RepID=A0A9E8MUQ8_9FLAO|nr:DUF423 domain-containing protein [Lacinutrix neustonica]WAC01300.1 DUF423 domain-containing protein [Lacinutrix neustonica]